MLKIIIIALIAFYVLCFVLAVIEVRKAPTVPDKEPFLTGDYDPKKDPTLQKENNMVG
jgi:hypothetical protein